MLSCGKLSLMATSGARLLTDLRGIRLGARERELLLRAPPAREGASIFDMLALDDPSRTVRVAQARAARKLNDLGLLTYWKQRAFERRVYVALTPLGAEVIERYGDELRTGQRIRWPRATGTSERMET
jgi:hypothetical protein